MKKFIMTSPYQQPEKLKKSVYTAADNSRLQYNKPISFPLLAAINGYAEQGESIEVIVIRSAYENSIKNYESFKEELEGLCKEKGIRLSAIKPIDVPYNDLLDTQLDIFSKLIEQTDNDDTIYCCMTYGTKAIPMVQMMALNYAYKIHKNVSIGCIVYGAVDFNTGNTSIYDITSLFYMNEIIDRLSKQKLSDPAAMIKQLLG